MRSQASHGDSKVTITVTDPQNKVRDIKDNSEVTTATTTATAAADEIDVAVGSKKEMREPTTPQKRKGLVPLTPPPSTSTSTSSPSRNGSVLRTEVRPTAKSIALAILGTDDGNTGVCDEDEKKREEVVVNLLG